MTLVALFFVSSRPESAEWRDPGFRPRAKFQISKRGSPARGNIPRAKYNRATEILGGAANRLYSLVVIVVVAAIVPAATIRVFIAIVTIRHVIA